MRHTKTPIRTSLLAAAMLWIALAGVAAPQASGQGTLAGQVLGLDGKAVEGARVILQDSDGGHLKTAETNAQGRFWFPTLPVGLYDLRASFKGHSSEWKKNIWVERGHQTTVTLGLKPKK